MGEFGGFDNTWNKMFTDAINKENRIRSEHHATAKTLTRKVGLRAAQSTPRGPDSRVAMTHQVAKSTPRCPASGVAMTHQIVPRAAVAIDCSEVPAIPSGTLKTPRSAAVRFLEEKMGLEVERPSTREALYCGVSHDGAGRAEYLRIRKKYGVTERHGAPLTETHWVGHFAGAKLEHTVSPYSKRPIIRQSFYREQKVDTHRDLPAV